MNNGRSRYGYRGYVASRPVHGQNFPQHVQNLVVRDYASRNGLRYLLSATEYAMPSCYLMLNAVLEQLPHLEGIIVFSAFMLPRHKSRRIQIFERVLSAGCELHAALEDLSLRRREDISRIEDLLEVAFALPKSPLAGRYEKDVSSAADRERDAFWAALSTAP